MVVVPDGVQVVIKMILDLVAVALAVTPLVGHVLPFVMIALLLGQR
jgi:hypothetical protein